MYINESALEELRNGTWKNLTPRRALSWAGFAGGWWTMRKTMQLGVRMDDAFFPKLDDHPVKEPVFVFANGRSGTTMLHRLLSLDTNHFSGFKLYQSLLPAASYRRVIQTLAASPLGAPGQHGIDWINKTFFSGAWEGIHAMGIDKDEEDEALFVTCLESPSVCYVNPFLRYSHLGRLDDLNEPHREAFLDFYERSIKAHLFSTEKERGVQGLRFLTKNVHSAPRIRSFLSRFPDARLIYLVRNPLRTLPSWLNMAYAMWQTHSPELPRESPEAKRLAKVCFDYYRDVLRLQDEVSDQTLRVVHYDALVKNPGEVVEELYEWLGMPISETYAGELSRATRKQARYKAGKRYAVEDFGLDEAWVRSEIPDVFEHYGFE